MTDKLVAQAAAVSRSVWVTLLPGEPAGSMLQGLKQSAAGVGGVLMYRMCSSAAGADAHWASHSSSDTSSGGMARVLLARMLPMLVAESRLAIPIRLTPVPSRFIWARRICLRNFKPDKKASKQRHAIHLRKSVRGREGWWVRYMTLPWSVIRVRLRLSLRSWLQRITPLLTTVSPTWVLANPST